MTLRAATFALAALVVATPMEGQAIRRVRPKAFPLSLTPFLALGWGGGRATGTDAIICAAVDCVDYSVGAGPKVGLEIQLPAFGTFGVGLSAMAGRPKRVACIAGQCQSRERLTTIHGSALLLWRFKARAPIYFGLGPAIAFLDPGPVTGQQESVRELGGAGVVAYDFRFSPSVGGRVAWWNYLMKPSSDQLIPSTAPTSLAWDTHIALGLRVTLGQ